MTTALGFNAELETQTIIAHQLGYLDKQKFDTISNEIDCITRMLSKLLKAL